MFRPCTIGDFVQAGVADIQTGPFGTQLKASEYVPDGVPVINVRNIGYSDLRPDKLEFVTEAKAEKLGVHRIRSGDIVFGRKGAVDRHLFVGADQQDWVQGSDCIRLRIDTDDINPRFISYALLSEPHKKWMLNQCGNKATMASLNQDVVKRIPLRVPNRTAQDGIVAVLAAYDDLIENNRRRITLLEDAARQHYKEWFVRFRFPGHEHINVVDDLPEGWERMPLGTVAEVVMGQSPQSQFYNTEGNGLPFHQGVTDYGFRFLDHRTYSTAITKLAEPNDILVSVRAPVGRINVTPDRIVLGRGLSAIRSKSGNQSFLFYALKNHFYAEDIIGTGAIYAATNKKELEGQLLTMPTERLIADFEDVVVPIDRQIANLSKSIEHLIKARDLLLPKLMNGTLTV